MAYLLRFILLPLLLIFTLVFSTSGPSAGADTAAVTLLRWPYLQQVTSTSAVVIWTTSAKGVPALLHGNNVASPNAAGVISRVVTTPGSSYYEHKVVLTGLKQNSHYFYQIFDNGVKLTPSFPRIWFGTAPLNGNVTFLAFGDSGAGTAEQYELAARMREQKFNILIHTGDLAYPYGSYAEFESYYFDVYKELLISKPMFPAIGNHEYYTDNGTPYLDVFDLPKNAWRLQDLERYYSFDWGDVHFISLDSETPLRNISGSSDTDMADWLVADLAADDHFWKIVIIHRPPYSSSPAHPETDVREKLVPIFKAYGVDMVLSGHNHIYERTYPIRNGAVSTLREGGTAYVVTGGGGAALYPVPGDWFTAACAKVHHFVKVDVSGCALTISAIDSDGVEFDYAVLEKCPFQTFIPRISQN